MAAYSEGDIHGPGCEQEAGDPYCGCRVRHQRLVEAAAAPKHCRCGRPAVYLNRRAGDEIRPDPKLRQGEMMDVPPEIRSAAERLSSELRLHVEHYGCVDDQPETYNHDLKIVTEFVAQVAAERDAALGEVERLTEEHTKVLRAANSILWMAEKYAEGGGSRGPEMRDYRQAESVILGTPLEDDDSEDD